MTQLSGTDGPDVRVGTDGDDVLNLWDGADTADGGAGNDILYGGSGDDRLSGGAGDDELVAGEGRNTLYGGAGDDLLDGWWTADGDQRLFGEDGQDTLWGGSGDDLLSGGTGDDVLDGSDGNDTLEGGGGRDTLQGGEGNDTYRDLSLASVILDVGGQDVARVAQSFIKLPSTIETVEYEGGAKALPYWIDALLPDEAAGNAFAQLLGKEHRFLYTFPGTASNYLERDDRWFYRPFDSVQQKVVRAMLDDIGRQINLTFAETADPEQGNTLAYAYNRQTDSTGYAYYPEVGAVGSDVFLDNTPENRALADGTYAAVALIHETGHALGLEHPFAHPGDAAAPHLGVTENVSRWTIMTYELDPAQYHVRFAPLDLAALHYLYGPSPAARSGNDIYTFDVALPTFVWDGGGVDWLSAANAPAGVTLHLSPGEWSFVGAQPGALITQPGQLTVNFGTVLEGALGSRYADWLRGADGAETLDGGAGDDRLDGGAGDDMLVGGAGDDVLDGGEGNDTLDGGAGSDTLDGGAGSDHLSGGAGEDTLILGGARSEVLREISREGAETLLTLSGGARLRLEGIEWLRFQDEELAVRHLLDNASPEMTDSQPIAGARGVDPGAALWVRFSESLQMGAGGVRLLREDGALVGERGAGLDVEIRGDAMHFFVPGGRLSWGTGFILELDPGSVTDQAGNAGKAARVTFVTEPTPIVGTAKKDTLAGTFQMDWIRGEAGNDSLRGAAGADTLDGGEGKDTLWGGAGMDVLVGGAGADVFAFGALEDSTAGAADRIADFFKGDRIDLRLLDARPSVTGNQAFTFLGAGVFRGREGEVRFASGNLEADLDGDRRADLTVELAGVSGLVRGDLLL